MNILIAPDKFKGSLTAAEVCEAVKGGILQKYPEAKVISVPLADGGEGTHELLKEVFKSVIIEKRVLNPLFQPVQAHYSISDDGHTAIIEMASASGLQLLEPDQRNPLYTTTFGTGELIEDALNRGVKKIILGIGGSATNDAGIGMASALGYQFHDATGAELKPIGKNLIKIESIDARNTHPRLKQVEFITLCDVSNPLHGLQGAAYVYGPQKGADRDAVSLLDVGLVKFEKLMHVQFDTKVNFPGAGAAGGLGAGTKAFLNATLKKGIEFIISVTSLEEKIRQADLVITGEGKIDQQSLSGKVVMAVSRLATNSGKPVIAICGKNELTETSLAGIGVRQCISLLNKDTSETEAISSAALLIKKRIIEQMKI
jgi:glycerate 2-kinase